MPRPEDIYEESVYTIKATLKSGIFKTAYKGKLDLIYERDGTQIKKDSDLDVTKGSLQKTYDVPKVKDSEDNYQLTITAKYGKKKEKTLVLAQATVWPKTVKLTVTNDKDATPVKNLRFSVVFNDRRMVVGDTDENGIGNADLRKSPFTLSVKAPWEVVSTKNDPKKREYELKVKRNTVAKILKPDITDACYIADDSTAGKNAGVRQYVNMATAAAGCDAMGNQIEFEICDRVQTDGLKDDKIYIKVEFSKTSKRNDPLPALLAPVEDIQVTDAGKTFTGYVKLDADGGTAKFQLDLGLAGGEKFKVSCGCSKADPTDDDVTIVTWRKLCYQLRFPDVMTSRMTQRARSNGDSYYDVPDSVSNLAKARLGAVFVEFVNIESHQFSDPAVQSPSLMTKGFLRHSNAVDQIYVMDGSYKWIGAATAFDPVVDSREITITLCDAAISSSSKTLTPAITVTAVTTEKVVDPDSSYRYFKKKHTAANTDNAVTAGYSWRADLTGVDPLAVAAHPGSDDSGNPRTGPMTDVTITHTTSRQKRIVLATGGGDDNPLPGDFVGPASATKCPIIVEFSMVGSYEINGNAGGGAQLLVLRDTTPGACSATVCHELGHSMGMAVMPLTGDSAYPIPPGLTAPTHVDSGGTYYLDSAGGPYVNGIRNLHRGPHCCHGMPADKKGDPKFSGWSPGAADEVCIMWGSGGDDDNRKQYCPVCTEVLKARDLSDVRSGWAGRTDP